MFVAPESIAGEETMLDIVIGGGVLLLFAAILIRALAAQRGKLAGIPPLRALLRVMGVGGGVMRVGGASARRDLRAPGTAPVPAGVERLPNRASLGTRPSPAVGGAPRVAYADRHRDRDCQPARAAPALREPELARVPRASVRRLGRTLDESRRLLTAEECVARDLAALPVSHWLIERNVYLGVHRIPFLAIGSGGIVVICATDGAWTLRDLYVLSELGEQVSRQLAGYRGAVRAAVCLAFDEMKPRSWFGGQEERGRGGWVLGLDWLRPWMSSLGPEHGLRSDDVRRLDEASGPDWERRSIARLPTTRNAG